MAFTGMRPGQADGAGDAYANLPEIWQKEIFAAFQEAQIAEEIFKVKRPVQGGHSAKFHITGNASAKFHAVGEDLYDDANTYATGLNKNIMEVKIDRPLVAVEKIDLQELGMTGVDAQLRMEITRKLGHAIGKKYDTYLLSKAVMAARATHALAELSAGGAITDADAKTNAVSLIDSIIDALERLDDRNVPDMDRSIVVPISQYWLLFNDSTNNLSRFNLDKDIGGNGSFSQGKVGDIAGVKVMKSKNFPTTDLSSAITGDRNDYSADFSTTAALVCHNEALAIVKREALKFHSYDEMDTLEHRIQAMIEMGAGVLRPECAVEIKTS